MKIGFLCQHNPLDRAAFSGTVFYMNKALQRIPSANITIIGKCHHEKKYRYIKLLQYIQRYTYSRIKPLERYIHKKNNDAYLHHAVEELKSTHTTLDIIIAPVASAIIAKLPNELALPPILFITDATTKFLEDTYKWQITKDDFTNETIAICRSALTIYSSSFMEKRALKEYHNHINKSIDKIISIPFGLNMDEQPKVIHNKKTSGLNLLFVGKNWQRKGGYKALSCLEHLLNQGVDAHLTIIGCNPDIKTCKKNTTVIPFIDKNNQEQQKKYIRHMSSSHFLILPTLADCTPMVIAEANAYGTPVLVTDIGGIATLVKDGENGALFSQDATGVDYGEKARALISDHKAYRQLCKNSYQRYKSHLNWEIWAKKLIKKVEEKNLLAVKNTNKLQKN